MHDDWWEIVRFLFIIEGGKSNTGYKTRGNCGLKYDKYIKRYPKII